MRKPNKLVVVLLSVSSCIFAMEDPADHSYDRSISPENSLPPIPASPEPHYLPVPNLQYDPLQPQSRFTKYNFGTPGPQSNVPSLMFGPPPLPSTSLDYQNPSGTTFSLFDDACGAWKALSLILLAGVVLVGSGLVFGHWDRPFSEIFQSRNPISKIDDPDFVSTVNQQIGDISRILTSIQEANDKPKKE